MNRVPSSHGALFISWGGVHAVWGLVVNTAANWLTWQGYLLFLIGGKDGSWASANLGVIVALFGALAFQRGDIAKQEADLPASETADAIEAK